MASGGYQPLHALVARTRGRPSLRLVTGGIALLAVLLALAAVLLIDEVGQRSREGVSSALAGLSALRDSAIGSGAARCPATCAPDYYASPGMIRWGDADNATRWSVFSLPTDRCLRDTPPRRTAQLVQDPQAWMDSGPAEPYLAPDYMSWLVDPPAHLLGGSSARAAEESGQLPERLDDIRNTQVLFVGG